MKSSVITRQRIVLALYGVVVGLHAISLAGGPLDAQGRHRIPLLVRMVSSAILVVCGLVLARDRAAEQSGDRSAALMAAGMGCGFVGDLAMAQVLPLPNHVIGGMLAFGVGHVLYIRAFVERARRLGQRAVVPTVMGGAWLIAGAGWWALVRNPSLAPALNYGALVYAALLSSMGGCAVSLATQEQRQRLLALAGPLFIGSDMLLARELFQGVPAGGDIIWVTYITSQALIVYSSLAAKDSIVG